MLILLLGAKLGKNHSHCGKALCAKMLTMASGVMAREGNDSHGQGQQSVACAPREMQL